MCGFFCEYFYHCLQLNILKVIPNTLKTPNTSWVIKNKFDKISDYFIVYYDDGIRKINERIILSLSETVKSYQKIIHV